MAPPAIPGRIMVTAPRIAIPPICQAELRGKSLGYVIVETGKPCKVKRPLRVNGRAMLACNGEVITLSA